LEVTITNMIVSNKKVNKTKIKLKSLVTGDFFFPFLFFCFCFCSLVKEKKNQFTMRVSGKKNTFTCCKNTFPNFNITHSHFQTFIHSFLVRWLDVSAKRKLNRKKKFKKSSDLCTKGNEGRAVS